MDPFFRNFSGWTEPIHWVLDRNFRNFWLNGSRQVASFFRFHFARAKAMWSRFSNQRMETSLSLSSLLVHMADGEQWREIQLRVHSFIRKENTPFWREKALKNTWPFMRLIVFEEQARIQSSESDAREEEVLAWKHDVSFKSKSKCLICKGQYSPSSADMCCANAMCAKNSAVNLWWWYKNKKCSNAQWGLAWALKASLKASVLAASIIVSGSSFHSLTDLGKSYIHIYQSCNQHLWV